MKYKFTRVEEVRSADGVNVIGFVIGLTATENETSEYVDTQISVEPKPNYTIKEVRNLCFKTALENDWYNILKDNLEAKLNKPIIGSSFEI